MPISARRRSAARRACTCMRRGGAASVARGAQVPPLRRLAVGIDAGEVEPEQEVKLIGHEDTYDEDIRDREVIEKELLSLAHRVSSRLRRKGFRGRTVTLKVKYHNLTQVTRAATLPSPTDDGATIYRPALAPLDKTEA